MSGLEVVGAVSAVIGIIDAITKIYVSLSDAEDLPQAFRKVADRLQLVQDTLQTAEKHIEPDLDDENHRTLKALMLRCKTKAAKLEEIFKAVVPSEDTPRLQRYRMAVRRLGKGHKVESLMKEVMEDVRLLAQNRAVKAATEDQVSQLLEAIRDLDSMDPSLPDEDSITLNHYGSGDNVAKNKYGGNHNENSGSGTAYFGPVNQYVRVMTEVRERVPRQECLKSLSFPRMNDRANDFDVAAAGTCGWLFQHPEYTSWVSRPEGFLVIKGKPGSGKSTLLRYALNNIITTLDLTEGIFLSFFFHGRGNKLQRTPTGLFRSLLYQLLTQAPNTLPDLVATFQQRYETMGKPGKEWRWHLHELQRFFKSSLSKVLITQEVWLFIDALYECDRKDATELAREFRSWLQKFQSPGSYQLRICLTSRHYPDLELGEKSVIPLDTENCQDIATLVEPHFTVHPNTDVGRLIIERSQGIFMWARLVLDRVLLLLSEAESTARIKTEITRRIPGDVTCLYDETIKGVKHRSTTIELMQWICFSVRPLTTDELRWAMAVTPNCTSKSLNECECSEDFITLDKIDARIKALSRGLVEAVPPNPSIVQFIHPSVKDFLVERGLISLDKTTQGKVAVPEAHRRLFRCCIRYLQMIFAQPGSLSKKDRSRYPLLHYATTSWISHAQFGNEAETVPGDLRDLFGEPGEFVKKWIHIYRQLEPFSHDCPLTETNLVHVASRYGLTKLLSCLTLNTDEVNIDARDRNGQTSLSLAAQNGHKDVIQLLLQTGQVDVDVRDQNGQTPLSWAARNGHKAVVELLFCKGKADIDARDNYNWTPLLQAAKNGHKEVVKLLLEKDKVDVNVRDIVYGQSPLSWAARNGYEAVVKRLLATGNVKIDVRDKLHQTSLTRAARNGHRAVVKRLLATNEVDINATDQNGQTPFSWATQNRHEAVTKMLSISGAKAGAKPKESRTIPGKSKAADDEARPTNALPKTSKKDTTSEDEKEEFATDEDYKSRVGRKLPPRATTGDRTLGRKRRRRRPRTRLEVDRRNARHEERRRAQLKEDEKPQGIKAAFKKLFSE